MLVTSRRNRCRTEVFRGRSAPARATVELQLARVDEIVGARFAVGGGSLVSRAVGCLVEPRVGDLVLIGGGERGRRYILVVVDRPGADGRGCSAELSVAGCEELSLSAAQLSIQGAKKVAVRSGGDLDLVSIGGTLRAVAANIVHSAASSIVNLAQHWMGRATQMSLDASALLRTHGRHHVMTASQEMRLDGERIHMG